MNGHFFCINPVKAARNGRTLKNFSQNLPKELSAIVRIWLNFLFDEAPPK